MFIDTQASRSRLVNGGLVLNAAMVGLGGWGTALAASVQSVSETIRITTCYAPSPESRGRFAARFAARPVDSYDDIVDDPAIDAVLIASSHASHLDLLRRAAAKGKHVFCEKPLTLAYADALAAAAACEAAGVVLAVGHNKRFSAAAASMKAMIGRGELGKPLHLESNYSFPGVQLFRTNRWRSDPAENPGGALGSAGIHVFDLAAWLLGPIVRVAAIVRSRSGLSTLDDTAAILLDFASGATGYVGCMFASPTTFFVNVYGTEGAVYAEPDADALHVHSPHLDGAERVAVPIEPIDTLRVELEAFAAACRGGPAFPVTPAEAVHSVAVMEAVIRSGREDGRPVAVPGGAAA